MLFPIWGTRRREMRNNRRSKYTAYFRVSGGAHDEPFGAGQEDFYELKRTFSARNDDEALRTVRNIVEELYRNLCPDPVGYIGIRTVEIVRQDGKKIPDVNLTGLEMHGEAIVF